MNRIAFLTSLLITIPFFGESQVLEKLGKKVERKVNQRVDRKAEQAIDKGLDKAEDAIEGKNKKENKPGDPVSKPSDVANKAGAPHDQGQQGTGSAFSAQSKFDFIPGEKVVAVENFSQDAIGDFPARWNTNASGEIMKLSNNEGNWLALTAKGSVTPEFLTSIPENATIEFDLAATPAFSYYNYPLIVSIAEVKEKNGFAAWDRFPRMKKSSGVAFHLHPQDAGSAAVGRTEIEIFENGARTMRNLDGGVTTFNRNTPKVHVAIWRQKQRVRIYVGEKKVWDLPRAFVQGANYNTLVFSSEAGKDGQSFYITNLRVAVGAPDTRHKLLEEGKFTTSGIYFATGSATIKSESHGVLKEIATVLNENPAVKVDIVGHTDASGDASSNQRLSEQRAAAVKQYLSSVFGVDNSRMTTLGKGQTSPVADNKTEEGKAQNRRVEFIKK